MSTKGLGQPNGQEIPHKTSKPSLSTSPSTTMPLQNGTERKEASFSANDINGTKRSTRGPSAMASSVSSADLTQKAKGDHGREPHSNGESPKPVSSIVATAEHLEQIWEWNSTAPKSVDRCIYDLINARVQAQPTAPAVCAWDGKLTYSELDDLATKLASRLRRLGVRPDIFVPLCFEKSMWTTVAVLGVIKAGGAFVLLDPSVPEQRLQVIIHQLQASVIVCSTSNGGMGSRLAERAIIINWDFFNATELDSTDDGAQQAHPASPASLVYAVFTSGSTGMPKGVLITNANAASALYHQAECMGMNQDARIFDFASYSFDVSVSNVLSALTTGGCLCVPSDDDRKDNLERSIASLEANILDITPSMAQVLSPDRIPSVRTVIFGGEALHPTDIKRWWGKVNIIHIYGPCECTPTSTINYNMAGPEDAVHIGKGVGLVTWIVDPEDDDTLLAPGCTGELLLEGPLVGRGYLNDDAKTAASFIEDPEWLLRGSSTKPGRHGRLYKTGDLVQYTGNGCLRFVGRKQAAQVKIRGQRLELGEIEHTLRNHASVDEAVAALQHEEGQETRIVSFVTVRGVGGINSLADNIREVQHGDGSKARGDGEYSPSMNGRGRTDQALSNEESRRRTRQKIHDELYEMLTSQLPVYMVPQVIEIRDRMPLNRNGKIDRLALVKALQGRIPARGPIRQPVSEAQRQMLQVWAKVLNIESSTIGTEASFFHLGGSSISAMRVVAEVRKIGMKLSVADIFRYPVLHELVHQSHHESPADQRDQTIVPFALLSDESALKPLLEEICIQYQLGQIDGTTTNTFICDAYPCTPLQEGLMSLTSMSPGSYISQNVLEISPEASTEKLRAAWEQIVRRFPILRTRLVHHDRLGLVQIVVDEPIDWIKADCLDDYMKSDIEQPMDLGQPLTRFALIQDDVGTTKWVVLTIHHALYDGWSLPLILDAVKTVYLGEEFRQGPQFQAFVQYVKSQDRKMMEDYWLDVLKDCQCAPFPSLPPHIETPMASESAKHSFPQPQSNRLGITPQIMIRAAWALLVGKMTSAEDVVFGVTLFGRNVPIPGIEMIAGPTFATVPVRMKWNRDDTAVEYLKAAQHQATGMIAYEQIGLHKLAELSSETRQACRFQTLLVIQPEDASDTSDELGTWRSDLGQGDRVDSYGLMLIVQLGADTVSVSASFDSNMIEPWRVNKLLNRLGHVVSQLDQAGPELLLADVETITPKELEQIWDWNRTVPSAAEQCVHKLFEQVAEAHPHASAVCAWDGEWTYRELDEASTCVANHLVTLGVGLEQIVPLCFEKSRWTPVAMLAVMKAGGASVALDSTQPEERLRTIVQQTEPALMLSSSANRELASRLTRQHVVVVDDSLLEKLKLVSGTGPLPAVTPSNKLYVAFTSGSTGVPKGAVISHRNFSSAVQHMRNSGCGSVEPTARVYDFASYAFDISWFNNLQSLTNGACLCIPSETDRRNDLAGSIHRLQATFAILTPSTANILPLETIRFLRTLMLAGEALPSEYAKRWVGLTRLTNGYGPCECTPITTVAAIQGENVVASTIGKGVGVNTWVVQPSNHNRLVPIGDVGELMLEGPLVSCGYLGDAKQTAAAFIQDPSWLRRGAPGHSGRQGRQGRLYKTGDLVRYDSDGSLVFVGRKDANQVKIRGQRVELGDVEHHVRASIPAAKQVAAEVILPTDMDGQGRSTLAAFLVVDDQATSSSEAQVMSVSAEVDHELTRRLPGYMVPTVYFSLNEFPTNSSGKVDRRRLRELGAGFTIQQLAQLRGAPVSNRRAPANEMERTIQQIWARVLGIDADKIGSDDSFFRLGGDSITAMQASAAARGLNLNISTADIMRSKTISSLATAVSSSKHHFPDMGIVGPRKDDGQPFELSPIQRVYVATQSHPNQCFDQNFFLRMREPISFSALSKAIEVIVMRHPMLRARFNQTSKGVWRQRIVDDASQSFHLSEVARTPWVSSSVTNDIRQCREMLNTETGPILAAVLFDSPGRQSLFISVHHLVIDLVSWRILLDELEGLLGGRELSPSPTTSFRMWCSLQAQYAVQNLQDEVHCKVEPPASSYWGLNIDENIQGAIASKQFMLDEESSSAILGACNEAFGTRPVELMIAALVYSFSTVFTDRPLPTVFSEGHGREPWDDRIDLSRVIGWFTTISPAFVPNGQVSDLVDTIRLTKDSVRSLSKNGWSYFTSKFVSETSAATNASDFPVEVLLNFAGSYQQLERNDSFFESSSISEDCHPESWLGLRRFALFEINAHVDKGQLAVSLEYPKGAQHGALIESWVEGYKATLTNLGALLSDRPPEWTLSDFPLAFASYADMEEFRSVTLSQLGLTNAQDIEDIFPCTGLQEGLLVAQFKSPDNYRVVLDFDIVASETPGDCIDISRIEQAWQAVVRRHALLRCILVDIVPGSSRTMHVVLKDPEPSMSFDQPTPEASVDRGLAGGRTRVKYEKYGLQHHLSVSRINEKHVRVCFELNHVILDGHSTGVMLHDFWQAYNGTLSADAPSYGDFIRYVEKRPRGANRDFWVTYLEGVKPCFFPLSKSATGQMNDVTVVVPGLDASKIHDFCSKWEVTTASVIQTAWALVLYHFTGCANPCFGNLASCRDVPVNRLDDMFGPVIAMIPYRVRLDGGHSVVETLREAQKDFVDSLPHQTFSLMEIHEALDVGAAGLFNSILSFQRVAEQPNASEEGHTIRERSANDPVEYPISLSVGDSDTKLSIDITFKGGFLSSTEADRVAKATGAAVSSLISEPHKKIGNDSLLTRDELERIWTWNSKVPEAEERCAHNLVEEQSRLRPESVAVCGRDGELTYKELDRLANSLAQRLVSMGIGPGAVIPLCFEKSIWTPVAALGVLKAGASFALLDPSFSEERLRDMVQQLNAKLLLSSSLNLDLSSRLCRTVVQVGPELDNHEPATTEDLNLLTVSPSAPMYISFTSGSTGPARCVVLSHRNFCSSLRYQSHLVGFSQDSRVLDLASGTFDASSSMFATFAAGGCLCIPTEKGRLHNPSKTIAEFKATLLVTTPSLARLIDPMAVPELETIILTGEAASTADAKRWWNKLRLVNAYGLAECSISTINWKQCCAEEVVAIGKGAGLVTWVVDPRNHDSLLPPGCVGELLLEGPLVGCGYLGDRTETDAGFINDPKWLLMGVPGREKGRHGRLYKTGDLVRYNVDGSLVFIGRKEDTQAKINGQKIELEEVEYWAQNYMPETDRVVAEIIKPQGGSLPSNSLLAMFVQSKDETLESDAPGALLKLLPIPADVEGRLAKSLPAHMMPSLLFSVSQLPMTTTGNVDRKRLREMAAEFSTEQIETVRCAGHRTKRQPTSKAERVMQNIWAKILSVSIDMIGLDDNFFRLGGDSILSMRLVSEARKFHINITVADVFHRETLAELVNGQNVNGALSGRQSAEVVLVDASTKETLLHEIDSLGSEIRRKDIADILPVTSVQERCFVEGIYPVVCINQENGVAGTACGRFANYVYVDLPDNTDVSLLEKACMQTLRAFPILRASFLQLQGTLWQVVLHQIRHPFRVQDVSENLDVALQTFCLNDAHKVSATQPPVSLVLLRNKAQGGRLIIRISHAQYDGICLPAIISSFINGHVTTPTPPSFSAFLSYVSHRRSKSIEYWKRLLQGSQQPGALRKQLLAQTDIDKPELEAIYIRAETNLPRLPSKITPATLASAAWARLLSRLTGQDDVVYGHLVAGRNSEIAGIDKTVGCCLNYIPVRVKSSSTQSPAEFLLAVQEQFLAVGEADSLGYKEIIKNCTDWPPHSTFESTIQHQNIEENPRIQSATGVSRVQFFENPHLVPMSIHMVSQTRGDKLYFELNSNTHIMNPDTAKAMVDDLVSIVDSFNTEPLGC